METDDWISKRHLSRGLSFRKLFLSKRLMSTTISRRYLEEKFEIFLFDDLSFPFIGTEFGHQKLKQLAMLKLFTVSIY